MTSKAVPTVVRQLRIVFCPRCKSSTGMRSFLQENLPTLKRSIAESSKNSSSKNPQNPSSSTSTTVLMIRESKGAPPQAFLKLEGKGAEQLFTFTDLNSRAIKSQLAAFFPQLNQTLKEVKGRAGQPKSLPRGSARFRANSLEASKVAQAKAAESSKPPEPIPAKLGCLKSGGGKKKKKNLDRASFHAARKAGVKGRPAKNLDFQVVFGTSSTSPPSACNAFWADGRQGPASWASTKLKGPKKSVFDESGISKRRLGLPKAACNAFWGAGRQGPSSWEVVKKKFKCDDDERASWSKKKGRNRKVRSCAEEKGAPKEPTIVPEPACNQFWGNGEKGPKNWTKPEVKKENSKSPEKAAAEEEGWFKWTLGKLSTGLFGV